MSAAEIKEQVKQLTKESWGTGPNGSTAYIFTPKAKNKDGEEFSIANMFRFSNPEILEESESDGKKSIQIDDSPMALVGKNLQAFFYKNGNGYTEVSQKVVPATAFQNAIDNITEDGIERIKQSAERYINNRKQTTSKESVDDVF